MIGDAASFLGAQNAAFLLQAGDNAFDRYGEVIERYRLAIAPRRNDSRFVDLFSPGL